MLANIVRWFSGGKRVQAPRVAFKYDAAARSVESRKHWANADLLSAEAANSPEVRRILRSRSRYEVANNSYASGVVLTLQNYLIGSGPRLQLLIPASRNLNTEIEAKFCEWAMAVKLGQKLRTMKESKTVDGEAFLLLRTNPGLPTPVKLDVETVEADQVTTPNFRPSPYATDGIVFDEYANPRYYHVLKSHPGSSTAGLAAEVEIVPAAYMIHWFRPRRPGQVRGIPEIMPALPLFAMLRRYTLAVLGAAETAADFAAVIQTDSPADGEAQALEPMDVFSLETRSATVLPAGWSLGQLKAEQPTNTYPMFKAELLNEIGRCVNMPFNLVTCNSSSYNYSSGRLDYQCFYADLGVERNDVECYTVRRVFLAWLEEAGLIPGYIASPLVRQFSSGGDVRPAIPQKWYWDGLPEVDVVKSAEADDIRLLNNTTTLSAIYARDGGDWEVGMRQRAVEQALQRELGVVSGPPAPPASDQQGGKQGENGPPQSTE